MDCQKAYQNLSAYLHKELLPNIRVELDEHLKECPYCRKRLDALKQINMATAELNCLKAPDNIVENVLNAVYEYEDKQRRKEAFSTREKYRPRFMFGFSLGISAALLILGVFFTGGMFNNRQLADTRSLAVPGAADEPFDKADLVMDNPSEIIKMVQNWDGERYVIVNNQLNYPEVENRAIDTVYYSPYDNNSYNGNMVKTGSEIVF
ncbi:MAG: hypothetical protein GF307_01850 [candidate division Zixibacteria bacterium]|nr:hypothetical protein [candidate division Zixibacteria bacterium]